LITVFDKGIEGYFYGSLLGSSFAAIFGWFIIRDYINFKKMHYSYWPKLIKFGFPLVPVGMAFYALNLGDRWFVKYLTNDFDLGLFAVGAKVSLIVTVCMETLRKAWWPHILESLDQEDGKSVIQFLTKLLMTFGVSFLILFIWLSPQIITFLTTPLYYNSWPITCTLGFASFFNSLFLIASIGMWKEKKTYLNIYILLFSFAIGCLLNFIFIPKYGILGAAFTTLTTCFIWIFITYNVSEKFYKTELPIKKFIFQILICTFYLIWIISIDNQNLILSGLIAMVLIFLNIFILYPLSHIRNILKL
jgi:O-antigen/teichoic acid export membrane protein